MKIYKNKDDDCISIVTNIKKHMVSSQTEKLQRLVDIGFFPCIHYTDKWIAEILMEIESGEDNQLMRYCPVCDVLDTNIFRHIPPKHVWIIK